jgi:hypothetical protein
MDVAVKAVSIWWNAKKSVQSTLDALAEFSSTTPRIKKND